MALVTCPECSREISDKAATCPQCGYPMNLPTSPRPRIRNGKPTRMPNGFGSIHKLPGKRRKPFRARKTDGWTIDANTGKLKQNFITIGYYETREQAMIALSEFNANPYDIKVDRVTFEEVYEKWSESYFPTLGGASSIRTITAAYKYFEPIYKVPMRDLRTANLEGVILNAQVGDSTKGRMKSILNMMYKYALAHDITEKDYASVMFSAGNPIKQETEKEVVPFNAEEISALWDALDEVPFVDMVLVGIYSGWRPQELSILKVSDIDLENDTMRGGLKTDAGKNRIVPIHSLIKPLIEKRMGEANNLGSDSLFNDENGQQGMGMTYDKWRGRFNKIMKRLNMTHRPHEARHTFITKAKAAGMDEYILKLIVGHSITDITEKTYTHRTIEQLKTEMEKIQK